MLEGVPALLGMFDIQILVILSVKRSIVELRRENWETNRQRMKDQSCKNKNSNVNSMVSRKINTKWNKLLQDKNIKQI